MKKLISISLSVMSLSLLVACGPSQMPIRTLAPNNIQSMRAANPFPSQTTTNKAPSNNLKQGINALNQQSKNQPKQSAPVPTLAPASRDLPTSSVRTIARLGLDNMERARTYEDGYNIGRSTIDTLARENSYIARLAQAATNPQMGYESAYKATAHALTFIANDRQISISAACELVRQMMGSAKTYEDGARMGYGTMDFIRQSASYSIQSVIDSTVRAAQSARYWEDSYNLIYNGYGSIRYMN